MKELLNYLKNSPSPFHAIDEIKKMLDENDFIELFETRPFKLEKGKSYYVRRNDSSILAFTLPKNIEDYHFQICASHSDSPTYKLKRNFLNDSIKNYLKLNVEAYGGMLDYTWFDKPLSLAGKVVVSENFKQVIKHIYIDKDILLIPSLAIHQNREANSNLSFNRQIDLQPIVSCGDINKDNFIDLLCKEIKVDKKDLISYELNLVNRQEPIIWGLKNEFISSAKIDNLLSAYTSIKALINSKNTNTINVCVVFDNEEVGSNTKQGAMSTFMKDILSRVNFALKYNEEDFVVACCKSFMVSFDGAHALHPNKPEKYDSLNCPQMNKGIVIKQASNQLYCTDCYSEAVFKTILDKNNIPYQNFANRSDLRGGSTLGNLSNTQISMHAIDVGISQLAMHSSYETCGSLDVKNALESIKAFYDSTILIENNNFIVK